MPGNVYNPDHTAHIRDLLKQLAMRGATGLLAAGLGVISALIVTKATGEPLPAGMTTAVWILLSILVAVSLLCFVLTLIFWLIYLWRRADLDARGAETVGELKARMANARRHPHDGDNDAP